jgi:prepilin-type N-terminal cleavage/methylation domain-containing protein
LRHRTNRGFTLIELLVVVGIGSIVLGGLAFLYSYTAGQTGDTVAELIATDQATTAANDVEATVRNAFLCEAKVKNGIAGLRCQMPSIEVDLNGDGIPESYAPASLDKFGREKFVAGKRVWYYMSDATGTWGSSGAVLWRATRSDDSDPTSSDLDRNWAYRYGVSSAPRFPLVTNFGISVASSTCLVTLDLSAESADYAERQAVASDASSRRRGLRLISQMYWRNWRS